MNAGDRDGRRQREARSHNPGSATAPAAGALALAALVVAMTVAWQAATLLRLDLAFTAAETELSFRGRGNYQPTAATLEQTERALDALLAAAPNHPDYLALAAYHEAWLAYREDDPAAARPYALRAVATQYGAQQNRPAYRQGWAKLVEYARRAGNAEGAAALGTLAQRRQDALQPPTG